MTNYEFQKYCIINEFGERRCDEDFLGPIPAQERADILQFLYPFKHETLSVAGITDQGEFLPLRIATHLGQVTLSPEENLEFQNQIDAAELDLGLRVKQVIVLRKDLNMRKGKLVAQGSHASMIFLTDRLSKDFRETESPRLLGGMFTDVEIQWLKGLFTKIVASVDSEQELEDIYQQALAAKVIAHKVIDSGLTEFHGEKTFTAVAIGPDYSFKIDPITKHLKLL